jgi:hypothetical protein
LCSLSSWGRTLGTSLIKAKVSLWQGSYGDLSHQSWECLHHALTHQSENCFMVILLINTLIIHQYVDRKIIIIGNSSNMFFCA